VEQTIRRDCRSDIRFVQILLLCADRQFNLSLVYRLSIMEWFLTMAIAFSFLLSIPSLIFCVLVALFLVEVCAAVASFPNFGRASLASGAGAAQQIAVLIPAHNESAGIVPTISDAKAQLGSQGDVFVVADNCSDDTAAVAHAAGAKVVPRDDLTKKGKGYALAWGLRELQKAPPDIVVIVDADCRMGEGMLAELVRACLSAQRPVQALDLMTAPTGTSINFNAMEFAWRVKNWARPLGLKTLGMPCHLMGTGMAFPWRIIQSVELASGSLVEDLKLGLELASTGNAALFCPSATVTSEFPTTQVGVQTQRQRWERGHLGIISSLIPQLIFRAVKQANLGLLVLALDAAIPPLSLLGAITAMMVCITGLASTLGASSAPLFISFAGLAGFAVAVFLSWMKFGRDLLPLSKIHLLFWYVLMKLPAYVTLASGRSQTGWERADRRKTPP